MKEPQRILELFENLYNGEPWLDITLIGTLQDITAEHAALKKHPDQNSIWEITNHLIKWRFNVLDRVKGNAIETPPDNYFFEVQDTSPEAWQSTLGYLELSEKKWIEFLQSIAPKNLDEIYISNGLTNYEHIHGIIQHDAYHLGQIVMLSKYPY